VAKAGFRSVDSQREAPERSNPGGVQHVDPVFGFVHVRLGKHSAADGTPGLYVRSTSQKLPPLLPEVHWSLRFKFKYIEIQHFIAFYTCGK